jgi:hypothetical protein
VQTGFVDPGRDVEHETICVVGTVENPNNQSVWATLGQRQREETFGLLVVFWAAEPGQEAAEAMARLRELTDPVEAALRTVAGTQPTKWLQLGVPGVVWAEAAAVAPEVMIGQAGYVGYCEMTVAVRARI